MIFADWYRECRPRLVVALTVLSGDRDAAVDAADEAMVRALERWDRVGAMASPDGWAYRVGANVLRRRFRRRALERRLWHRADPVVVPDLKPEVWDAVKGLPARQREAVALRYVLCFSEAEVAAAMGVAVGTASSTLAAARSRLNVVLADEETEVHPQ